MSLPLQPEWKVIFNYKLISSTDPLKTWLLSKELKVPVQPRPGMVIKKGGIHHHVVDEVWDDDLKAFIVDQEFTTSEKKAENRVQLLQTEGWRLKATTRKPVMDAVITTKAEL